MNEEESFKDAMSDVAPLQQRRVRHEKVVQEATTSQMERREAALGNTRASKVDPNYLSLGEVPQKQPRDILEWKKDGVQHEVFKKLKSGRYPIEGSLDLHGCTVKEARIEMFKFLNVALVRGWRTVLIAHGRGELSKTPARIKSRVAHWLEQIPEVIAFHSAQNHHGGTGAVYVLLKKTPLKKDENRERYGLKGDNSPSD
ncbi:MAG: DNA endonuclease SmrA [Gammaproteobacteria bacterium]|nr:MAG: DNA endonuclease SmrA [Gammaproteobacteria bacterium]